MADALGDAEQVDKERLAAMLRAGIATIVDIGGAQVGDKTLIDVLVPAERAFDDAVAEGQDFTGALAAMKQAAADGLEATRGMVAKIGRASRLGERSRGTLDAGAASCSMLLGTLADGLTQRLRA